MVFHGRALYGPVCVMPWLVMIGTLTGGGLLGLGCVSVTSLLGGDRPENTSQALPGVVLDESWKLARGAEKLRCIEDLTTTLPRGVVARSMNYLALDERDGLYWGTAWTSGGAGEALYHFLARDYAPQSFKEPVLVPLELHSSVLSVIATRNDVLALILIQSDEALTLVRKSLVRGEPDQRHTLHGFLYAGDLLVTPRQGYRVEHDPADREGASGGYWLSGYGENYIIQALSVAGEPVGGTLRVDDGYRVGVHSAYHLAYPTAHHDGVKIEGELWISKLDRSQVPHRLSVAQVRLLGGRSTGGENQDSGQGADEEVTPHFEELGTYELPGAFLVSDEWAVTVRRTRRGSGAEILTAWVQSSGPRVNMSMLSKPDQPSDPGASVRLRQKKDVSSGAVLYVMSQVLAEGTDTPGKLRIWTVPLAGVDHSDLSFFRVHDQLYVKIFSALARWKVLNVAEIRPPSSSSAQGERLTFKHYGDFASSHSLAQLITAAETSEWSSAWLMERKLDRPSEWSGTEKENDASPLMVAGGKRFSLCLVDQLSGDEGEPGAGKGP